MQVDKIRPPVAPAEAGAGDKTNAGVSHRPLHAQVRREGFAETATRLAGLTGAVLGWRPAEFWASTPAELAVIFTVLAPAPDTLGADQLAILQEQFPDG